MANSKADLILISTRKLAKPGRRYYRDDGEIFIGTNDGRLRLLEKSEILPFNPIVSIPETNIQSSIEYIDNKLKLLSKQTEIDFGTTLYQTSKIFTINDSDITFNSIIVSNMAYSQPTNKSLDELEMDIITCESGNSKNGSFDLIVKSLTGSLTGAFKINYIIQWQ